MGRDAQDSTGPNGPALGGMITAPTQIANIPPDIPVGEKSAQNDRGPELKSVLHINIQHFPPQF